MKIAKASLVGMIALSMLVLSACDSATITVKTESSPVSSAEVGSSVDWVTEKKKSEENSNAAAESGTATTESGAEAGSETNSAKSESKEKPSDNETSDDHGYSEVTDPPASGISIAALEGSWNDIGIGTEVLTISTGSDIYHGNFWFRNDEGVITTGTIKLEQDSSGATVYSFYDDNGNNWNVFAADGVIPVDRLNSVLEGGQNFARHEDDETVNNVTSIEVYDGTYIEQSVGRAVITLSVDPSKQCWFHVRWPSSAAEFAEWDINCYYDDNGAFPYENGVKTVTTYDENGNETVTEENTKCAGCFILDQAEDGTYALRWNEENEKIADGCVFVKQ